MELKQRINVNYATARVIWCVKLKVYAMLTTRATMPIPYLNSLIDGGKEPNPILTYLKRALIQLNKTYTIAISHFSVEYTNKIEVWSIYEVSTRCLL